MITSFITHPDCALHDMGPWHPENPLRINAIIDQLMLSGLMNQLNQYRARPVEPDQLQRAHPKAHLRSLELSLPEQGFTAIEDETLLCPRSLEAASLASGAVVRGVDQVFKNQADNVFCAVRPPGHHAERVESMGFCFYNNVAVGALHALETYQLERVAIVDFDVHHGNGTVDIFRDDPRVMVCSSFQHPFYPWRYTDHQGDHIINTPLEAHTSSLDFRKIIEASWLPALQNFKPQLVLVSAGFDAHREDPMGELNLEDDDYYWITQMLMSVAATYCDGHLVSVLEGGYDLSSLARSVHRHIEALQKL